MQIDKKQGYFFCILIPIVNGNKRNPAATNKKVTKRSGKMLFILPIIAPLIKKQRATSTREKNAVLPVKRNFIFFLQRLQTFLFPIQESTTVR